MYKITLFIIFIVYAVQPCYAAFPIQGANTHAITASLGLEIKHQAVRQNNIFQIKLAPEAPPFGYAKGRKQVIAIVLSGILGFTGAHRFYLGYYGSGIVQLLMSVLFIYLAFVVGASSIVEVSALGFLGLIAVGIWILIDFIRICAKDLKPKQGEYEE